MPRILLPRQACEAGDLPAICVITGATDGVTFQPVALAYTPASCLLPSAFTFLFLRRKTTVLLPFSGPAHLAFRRTNAFIALSIAVFVVLASVALLLSRVSSVAGVVVLVLSLVLAMVVHMARVHDRSPECAFLDDKVIKLYLPSEKAAQELWSFAGSELGPPEF